MAQEKKNSSWAPDLVPNPEEYEQKEWEAKRQAALDNAMITIASALVELVNEQKRINNYLIQEDKQTSKAPTPNTPEKKTPPKTRTEAIANVDEDTIIRFYRDKIAGVLDAEDASKTTISVQENDVYIKFPWLGKEKFGPIGGLMRDLGAEYVSAGKDTHYLAPFPS